MPKVATTSLPSVFMRRQITSDGNIDILGLAKSLSGDSGVRMQFVPKKGARVFDIDATTATEAEIARSEIGKKIHDIWFKFRENWEDAHLPLQTMLKELRKLDVKISSADNMYQNVTAIAGKNDAQFELYKNTVSKRPTPPICSKHHPKY